MERLERMLHHEILWMRRELKEAELLRDQALADDLTDVLTHLERIHRGIGVTGQRYRSPGPLVRISRL